MLFFIVAKTGPLFRRRPDVHEHIARCSSTPSVETLVKTAGWTPRTRPESTP